MRLTRYRVHDPGPYRRAILALFVLLIAGGDIPSAYAQEVCVTFAQARRARVFARFNLRPAGVVKDQVETRTGGKIVSFLLCRPGPVYRLTVLQPNGNVFTVIEPAQ